MIRIMQGVSTTFQVSIWIAICEKFILDVYQWQYQIELRQLASSSNF
jgi:hypothetical protein